MGALEIVFGVILILVAIAVIAVVLLQDGKQQGMGAITGAAETFLSKNQARTVDAFLSKWTKFFALGFFLIVIIINMILYFT
ncbi:MAG: preprotein translocase subunit SecG [Ruminococcaceae bacterium]|nr:preprotein translocase subunit SecG [Oscillospiraceae bacterium]